MIEKARRIAVKIAFFTVGRNSLYLSILFLGYIKTRAVVIRIINITYIKAKVSGYDILVLKASADIPEKEILSGRNIFFRYIKACSKLVDRNSTHAALTNMNVKNTRIKEGIFSICFSNRFSNMRTTPCAIPQRMNVHAAPCHIPLTRNTTNRLKHVRYRPFLFPPSGN